MAKMTITAKRGRVTIKCRPTSKSLGTRERNEKEYQKAALSGKVEYRYKGM